MYKKLLILIVLVFILISCNKTESGFSIYLTETNIPIHKAKLLRIHDVSLKGKPIISINDINLYNSEQHLIGLKEDALNRLQKMHISLEGKSFVVCVGKKRIYNGWFYSSLSSVSFDGIVIVKDYIDNSPFMKIQLGYPDKRFYHGEDPRRQQVIIENLKKHGKLISK